MPKPATKGTEPRTCVLVLGMHRSGTLALGGTLGLLGCDLPASAIGGRGDNPKGFFESGRIQQMNDRILAAAGAAWNDWRPLSLPDPASLKAEAEAVLREEFGDSPLFLFKDPRNCRLADLWLGWLRAQECRTVVILPLRAPGEVAASLAERDGLSRQESVLLWLRHVLDAERATRKLPRVHTSYDALLDDWRGLTRQIAAELGLAWPRDPHTAAPEIDAFLERGLRHFGTESPAIPAGVAGQDWAGEVHAILKRWAAAGEDKADHKRLDAIRKAFDAAVPLLDPLLRSAADLSRGLDDQTARAEAFRQQLARAETGWQTTSEQLATANQHAEQVTAELRARQADIARLEQDLAAGGARIAGLEQDIRQRSQDQAALEQSRTELRREADESRAALHRATAEAEALIGRLAAQGREKEALEQSRADLQRQADDSLAEVHRLQRTLQNEQALRQGEAALLTRQVEELAEQIRTLRQRHAEEIDEQRRARAGERLAQKARQAHDREALAALAAERDDLRLRLRHQEEALRGLGDAEVRLARLQERFDETDSALRQRRHEVEQLHLELGQQKREALEARMEAEIVRGRLAALVEAGSRAEADLHRLRGDLAAQEDLLARERIGHKARQARAADEAAQAAARIAALTQQIAEQTTRIAAQEDRLQQLAAAEVRLEQERDALKRETAAIRDEASRTQRALEAARDHEAAEAAALRNSTSWRITAPLRRMVMLFRG